MEVSRTLDVGSIDDYATFLRAKDCPRVRFEGRTVFIPAEYAKGVFGSAVPKAKSQRWTAPDWMFDYQRDITRMAIQKRKYCVFADCCAVGTMIATEHGPAAIETIREPVRVWCRNERGERILSWASPSWVNGFAPIYEYRTETGRAIRATAGHRFMTDRGWLRGSELHLGDRLLVSDASHPRTTSESGPSTRAEGGPRWTRTTEDSRVSCSAYPRPDDAQPRTEQADDRSFLPSPTDARARNPMRSRRDDSESGSGRTHPSRSADRPSTVHSARRAATMPEGGECQPRACGQGCTVESIHTSRPFHEGTSHQRQGGGLHPSEDSRCEGVQSGASGFSFERLIAVKYITDAAFYDLSVPGVENYIADGFVSHNCGLGKTPILLAFAQHAAKVTGQKVLIVSPLMVVDQTIDEYRRFWPDAEPIQRIPASGLAAWCSELSPVGVVGITNYDAIQEDTPSAALGGLVLDESSMLKSHYGKWGTSLLRMGEGLDWKMCCTGTPAPNDRIEYANHAVFMGAFPTVNAFLARFFVNRGETNNRWELKAHAMEAFYKALSDWSIFLTNPAVYGWCDNCGTLPPIHVHIENIPLTQEQRDTATDHTGMLMCAEPGGITGRTTMARLAKGSYKGAKIATSKYEYIGQLIDSWPDEQTIIWCLHNDEQDILADMFPDAANIDGSTPYEKRKELIDDFKAGRRRILISKPKIMGFGVNLQNVTRQVFSGLQDSYESFYQAVKRSNRYGSTKPLNVHIAMTELETPMVQTVLEKRDRVARDTEEQERLFRQHGATNAFK